MKSSVFTLIGLLLFVFAYGQENSQLVLQKMDSSKKVSFKRGARVKLKTKDGQYHKGRLIKCEKGSLIITADTFEISVIEKVMVNNKPRRQKGLIMAGLGMVAISAATVGVNTWDSSNSIDWGRVFLTMSTYLIGSNAVLFGGIYFVGYNSYDLAGKKARWMIINKY